MFDTIKSAVTGQASDSIADIKVVQDRIEALRGWLRANGRGCSVEQKHLNKGSQERIYWHYGYMVALRDVLHLLTVDQPPKDCSPGDMPNSSYPA